MMKNKIKIIIAILFVIIITGMATGLYFWQIKSSETKLTTDKNKESKEINTTADNIDWSQYETYEITLNNKSQTISKEGVYKITGKISDGSIKINTEGNVKLILDNVTITNSSSPAIEVENAKNTYIELNGENNITAKTTEDKDGAIYSKDDLFFEGNGSLNVTSNYDGIVSKDDLTFYSGTYKINTEDDGIRGKDSVTIKDGTFTINSKGDGIKTTNEQEKGQITIDGGTFNIKSSDDGINSVKDIVINGGTFKIEATDDGIHGDGQVNIKGGTYNITSAEGIEATSIKIENGTININASDDGINAANKSTDYKVIVEISGGKITIKMGQGDTDAIDSNGDLYITGGEIDITAQSPFDFDGTSKFTGGTVTVNGEKVTTLSNQMMGAPGGENQNNMGQGMQRGERPQR